MNWIIALATLLGFISGTTTASVYFTRRAENASSTALKRLYADVCGLCRKAERASEHQTG